MKISDIYECRHCASPYGKPHDPDCILANCSPPHGEFTSKPDEFHPFHQMSPAQRDMIRHVWSQGMKFGRKQGPPSVVIFILGVIFGASVVIMTLSLMGLFN